MIGCADEPQHLWYRHGTAAATADAGIPPSRPARPPGSGKRRRLAARQRRYHRRGHRLPGGRSHHGPGSRYHRPPEASPTPVTVTVAAPTPAPPAPLPSRAGRPPDVPAGLIPAGNLPRSCDRRVGSTPAGVKVGDPAMQSNPKWAARCRTPPTSTRQASDVRSRRLLPAPLPSSPKLHTHREGPPVLGDAISKVRAHCWKCRRHRR